MKLTLCLVSPVSKAKSFNVVACALMCTPFIPSSFAIFSYFNLNVKMIQVWNNKKSEKIRMGGETGGECSAVKLRIYEYPIMNTELRFCGASIQLVLQGRIPKFISYPSSVGD